MAPTKRKIFLGQVVDWSLGLIAAAGMFFIRCSRTACWPLTALPGVPPAHCAGKSQAFARHPQRELMAVPAQLSNHRRLT